MDGCLSGVAYTSECFHCKPGTHSEEPGSARCTLCPADTYSNKGATVCQQCDSDQYSGLHDYIYVVFDPFFYLDTVLSDISKLTTITYLHVTTRTHAKPSACKCCIYYSQSVKFLLITGS